MTDISRYMLPDCIELADKVALQMIDGFNDITLEWFEPYGITRQNYHEYIPRILIEHMIGSNTSHFFLDGNYIFSIAIVHRVTQNETGDGYSITTDYRQFQRGKELDPEQED